MKSGTKRVLWGGAATLLILMALTASALLYIYRNPSLVKDHAIRALSEISGLSIHADALEWGVEPLRFRAEGIQASSPMDPFGGLQSSIRSLELAMRLEGEFGNRTLVIENAHIRELDLLVEGVPLLPKTGIPKTRGPSWAARAGAGLVSLLFFNDIRVEHTELEKGRVTIRAGTATLILDRVKGEAAGESMVHASMEARMEFTALGLVLDLPRIEVEAESKDSAGEVRGRLSIEEGVLEHSEGTVRGFSLRCLLDGNLKDRRIQVDAFDLHLPDIRPFLPMDLKSPLETLISASGTVLPQENRLENGSFRIALNSPPAQLDIETGINLSWGPVFEGALEVRSWEFLPSDWIPLLPPEYGKPLEGIDISGPVSISGSIEASLGHEGLQLVPDLSLRLKENLISFFFPSLRAGGRFSGHLRVSGGWPDLLVSAHMNAGGLGIEHPSFRIPTSDGLVLLSGSPAAINLDKAHLTVPEIHLTTREEPFLVENVRLQAEKGLFNPFIRFAEIPEVRLEADGLGPALIGARIRNGKTSLSAQGRETGILSFLSQQAPQLDPWNLEAKDSLNLLAETDDFGTWRFSAHLEFHDLSFENRPIDSFAEGVGIVFEAEGTAGKGVPVFLQSLRGRASSGEVLFGRFYLDMESHPLSINARTRMAFDQLGLLDSSLQIGIEDLISISISGSLKQAGELILGDLHVSIPWFDIEPAFQVFAVEPFGIVTPILRKISITGGASADLNLKSDETGLFVTGEVSAREVFLSLDEPALALGDLFLSLPISHGPLDNDPSPKPLRGRLEAGSVRFPFLPRQSMALDLEALPNVIRVPDDTRILIPGGVLRLSPITIAHGKKEGITIQSGAHLKEVDLGPLLEIFWPEAPKGRINGSLDPIVFRKGVLTSLGSLEAEVFEGHATVENIGASGIFGSAPVFGFDAHWEGLHLEQMTEGTAFGRITGILDGYMEGFEIAYGQPQRFLLLAETVERKGVGQRISVKAVDNIAQIGGGGSPFVGMAGYFTSLFREFPYERIGVRAVLESDTFRINGTIIEGDREYLIKRSGFSGVNVVNQNPDNRIGFKDMVKRIQRVTTSHGGPVIQ